MGAAARQRGVRLSYADERKAAKRAEIAALCSLVVVLLWGACLVPLPAGTPLQADAQTPDLQCTLYAYRTSLISLW